MEKIYKKEHRDADWQELLDELRKTHKAKRRLMAVLDTLSKKKLVDRTASEKTGPQAVSVIVSDRRQKPLDQNQA